MKPLKVTNSNQNFFNFTNYNSRKSIITENSTETKIILLIIWDHNKIKIKMCISNIFSIQHMSVWGGLVAVPEGCIRI